MPALFLPLFCQPIGWPCVLGSKQRLWPDDTFRTGSKNMKSLSTIIGGVLSAGGVSIGAVERAEAATTGFVAATSASAASGARRGAKRAERRQRAARREGTRTTTARLMRPTAVHARRVRPLVPTERRRRAQPMPREQKMNIPAIPIGSDRTVRRHRATQRVAGMPNRKPGAATLWKRARMATRVVRILTRPVPKTVRREPLHELMLRARV